MLTLFLVIQTGPLLPWPGLPAIRCFVPSISAKHGCASPLRWIEVRNQPFSARQFVSVVDDPILTFINTLVAPRKLIQNVLQRQDLSLVGLISLDFCGAECRRITENFRPLLGDS